MKIIVLLSAVIFSVSCYSDDPFSFSDDEKSQFCSTLNCDKKSPSNQSVCGIKLEGEGFRVRLFDNECKLLRYGCDVDNDETYGIIEKHYCDESFSRKNPVQSEEYSYEDLYEDGVPNTGCDYDCSDETETKPACAIKQEGNGFRIKLFPNKCRLLLYNCVNNTDYLETDDIDCMNLQEQDWDDDKHNKFLDTKELDKQKKIENIVVIRGVPFHRNRSVNDTINDFFTATHSVKLPIKPVPLHDLTRRTYHFDKASPVVIFEPWIKIPKNRSDDYHHLPTLSSCYHKCPTSCPDMYAPVCGVPGIIAKEPTLVFENHCYMDMAQCKMFREDKSDTAQSSNYVESSFLFCVGDEIFGLFRFVPLIRTLQRMGRLKQKGKFRYKFSNFKFINNRLLRNPNLMG